MMGGETGEVYMVLYVSEWEGGVYKSCRLVYIYVYSNYIYK